MNSYRKSTTALDIKQLQKPNDSLLDKQLQNPKTAY